MTFILYRNRFCLTEIDKLLFHNHFEIFKMNLESTNAMNKIFSLSLDKTHFLPCFCNESPDLYLLKGYLIVD